jgi:site-specific recombinase XerD
MNEIQNNGENYFIYRKQNKTGESINIPLSNFALEIIHKYDNDERKVTGKVLPQRSNQKINTYLKTIADLVGINKTLTHHVARHTCATILLNRGVPLDVVQKILGHSSRETTSLYAKMSSKTVENQVLNAMDGFEKSEKLESKGTGKT